MRSPDYKWGWIECDTAILHASFNLLKKFVEEEKKGQLTLQVPEDLEGLPLKWWENEVEIDHEILALYDWWTRDRFRLNQHTMDVHVFDREQHMLRRLVEIRDRLWT